MDYIEDVDLPDLPPSQLELLEGDALMLLRNSNNSGKSRKGEAMPGSGDGVDHNCGQI
jgi:hypothetical protein